MTNTKSKLLTYTRRLVGGLALLALAAAVTFMVLGAWSPRAAGRPIAARLHIPHPAVIAHRGLSFWAPEETRAAYVLARTIGADYLEADVQRTRDGVLIALHDETLLRTTNVAALFPERRDRGPEAFTWQELHQLDAGSWWNAAHPDRARPAYVGLHILRVEELLDLARGTEPGSHATPGLYLETKDSAKYPGYEAELVALLRAHGWLPGPSTSPAVAPVIFQSFDAPSLARLRELAPEVPRVLLLERPDGRKESFGSLIQKAQELGAQLGPSGYEAMPWHLGPAHRAGLLVHHYTINQPWQLRLVRQFGSDGVFTDSADRALEVYGRGGRGGAYDRTVALRVAFQKTGL